MVALKKAAGGSPIYQLKITLRGSKPAIWRRVLVRASVKFSRFHDVVQSVMGWTDSHLHQFMVKREGELVMIGRPDPEFEQEWGPETLDESRFVLSQVLTAPKQKLQYEYDFGDSWLHDIVLERILPPDSTLKHPVCVAGANACPPEDCGGLWGYYDSFLRAMNDPRHEEHENMKEWIGCERWDPADFDLNETNACLKQIKT